MRMNRTAAGSLGQFLWNQGPAVSALVAVAFALVMPQPPMVDEGLFARQALIRRTFESVPLRSGPWIGEEQPLAPSAVELLRPNAAISREYALIGGKERLGFSLVHCADSRDMAGHYPPICYPAHGWTMITTAAETPSDGSEPSARSDGSLVTTIHLSDGSPRDLRVYRFHRVDDALVEVRMSVFNAIILPDGTWGTSLESLRSGQARRLVSREGVAQLQIVVPGWPHLDELRGVIESFLNALPDGVWRALSTPSGVNHAEINDVGG